MPLPQKILLNELKHYKTGASVENIFIEHGVRVNYIPRDGSSSPIEGYYKTSKLKSQPYEFKRDDILHEHFYGIMLPLTLPNIAASTAIVYLDDSNQTVCGIFSVAMGTDEKKESEYYNLSDVTKLIKATTTISTSMQFSAALPVKFRYELGQTLLALYFYEQEDAHDKQFIVRIKRKGGGLAEWLLYTFDYDRCGDTFLSKMRKSRSSFQVHYDKVGKPFELNPKVIKEFPDVTAGFYWPATFRVLHMPYKGFSSEFTTKICQLKGDPAFRKGMLDQIAALKTLYFETPPPQFTETLHKERFAHYQRRIIKLHEVSAEVLQLPKQPSQSSRIDDASQYFQMRRGRLPISQVQSVPVNLSRPSGIDRTQYLLVRTGILTASEVEPVPVNPSRPSGAGVDMKTYFMARRGVIPTPPSTTKVRSDSMSSGSSATDATIASAASASPASMPRDTSLATAASSASASPALARRGIPLSEKERQELLERAKKVDSFFC